jgi:hypothetical protein
MSETTLQPRLPQDPTLRDSVRRLCTRPPLAPHLQSAEERAVAAWFPCDGHAEMVLLGACLVHQTPQPIIGLEVAEFFYVYHQRLAAAILGLTENHRPISLQAVRSFLNVDTIAVPGDYFLIVIREYVADAVNRHSGP